MPIRPENKNRYPKDWPSIAAAIRERAGHCCEDCGVRNYALGGRDSDGRWCEVVPKGTNGLGLDWPVPGEWAWCSLNGESRFLRIVKIVLTAAHLDHTPENCAPSNLKALCQRCHNLYDASMRRAGIKARARVGMAIGDLFGEVA